MRLLLLSQDQDVKEVLRSIQGSWEMEMVEDEKEFLRAFLTSSADVIALDVDLLGEVPTALIDKIRALPRGKMVPILLFSTRADRISILRGLRHGALDYILKPFDPAEFILKTQSLFHFLELVKQRQKDLEDLILIDPVTGCYHQNYLRPRLTEEVARAKRYGHHFGVLLFHLPGWQEMKKTFSEEELDDFRRMLASTFREMVRRSDAVIAWNGGDFLIIATETGYAGCQKLLERIQNHLSQTMWKIGSAIFPVHFAVHCLHTENIGYPEVEELMDKISSIQEGMRQ
ncbi:MAG: GGDEF domain-containing protein [bacterium JZ-2024 1]